MGKSDQGITSGERAGVDDATSQRASPFELSSYDFFTVRWLFTIFTDKNEKSYSFRLNFVVLFPFASIFHLGYL